VLELSKLRTRAGEKEYYPTRYSFLVPMILFPYAGSHLFELV